MAGVKGKSGGPRPNSGGARPGSGRKPKKENAGAKTAPAMPDATPLDVLKQMMNDPEVPIAQRIKAAQAAAPYVHQKVGEGGKKEQQAADAKRAANKFAASAPPKLVVNNRR